MRRFLLLISFTLPITGLSRAETALELRNAPVVTALDELDRWFGTDSVAGNSERWRKFLRTAELRAELAKGPQADSQRIAAISTQFHSNTPGLELPRFVAVGAALDGWLNTPRTTGELIAVAQTTNADQGYPNFFAEVTAPVVGAGVNQQVDEVIPVQDCILGTSIHGTGHTVGEVRMHLIPNGQYASMQSVLSGKNDSNTVGYHRPVTIYSTGTTTIWGVKPTRLDNNGIVGLPACAKATTCTSVNGICANTRHMQGMIERMAWKRVGKSKSQAEAIASSHAEDKIRRRMEEQAAPMIANGNKSIQEKFKKPLAEHGALPKYVHYSTTADALYVVALQASAGQVGAPDAAPELALREAMNVRVHETAVNNMMIKRYGGQTITNESVKQDMINLYGKVPDEFKEPVDPEDDTMTEHTWTMTFDAQQPIVVTFADQGFKVFIRGAAFTRDEKSYPPMDIRAEYKLEAISASGFKAKRIGDLTILPPDLATRPGMKKTVSETSITGILKKRFDKILKPELVSDGVELPNQWKKAGKLPWAFAASDAGWFSASWRMGTPQPMALAAE